MFTTLFILMFLLVHWNSSAFWTKNCRTFILNLINSFSFMLMSLFNIIRYLLICFCLSEYFESEFSTEMIIRLDLLIVMWLVLIRYAWTLEWNSCESRKSFTSSLLNSDLFSAQDLWDSVLKVWCFLSETCWTLKSKSWIHANQQLISAPDTSAALWFSCATKVCVLSLITKEISYRYA